MRKYTNAQKFNDGITVLGQVPIDDRLVFTTLNDIYISESTKNNSDLYGKAYTGMQVAIIDTENNDATIIILRDDAPYTPGKVSDVNENNYLSYWTVLGKEIKDYIYDDLIPNIDASIEQINSSILVAFDYIDEKDSELSDISINLNTFLNIVNASITMLDSSISSISDLIVEVTNESISNITSHLRTLDVSVNTTDEQLELTNINLDSLEGNVNRYKITVNGYVDKIHSDIKNVSLYTLDVSNNLNNYKNTNNSSIVTINNTLETLDVSIADTINSINNLSIELKNNESVWASVLNRLNETVNDNKKDIKIIKAFLCSLYPNESNGFQHFYDHYSE